MGCEVEGTKYLPLLKEALKRSGRGHLQQQTLNAGRRRVWSVRAGTITRLFFFLKLVFTLVVFSLGSTSSNIAPSSALFLPPAEGLTSGGRSLQLLPGRGTGS